MSDLPTGFKTIDEYMTEVMKDPERAKAIEEVRPIVLRIMNHALCDKIDALHESLREFAIAMKPLEAGIWLYWCKECNGEEWMTGEKEIHFPDCLAKPKGGA